MAQLLHFEFFKAVFPSESLCLIDNPILIFQTELKSGSIRQQNVYFRVQSEYKLAEKLFSYVVD